MGMTVGPAADPTVGPTLGPTLGQSARLPQIDPQRCTGCGRCVGACGPHLLSLEVQQWRKFSVLHGEQACTGCSDCAVVCPFGAIRMVRRPATGAKASG